MIMHFNIEKPDDIKILPLGENREDESFGVNSRYFLKNNKPWLPVMAEFHFSRYDENEWEKELYKIKAGGANIVSSYLFWIHHEEVKGEFNFKGNRNVREFLKLCKKVGLYAFIRIGPWCHGECRNGGFPDWLTSSNIPLRSLDKEFLDLTEKIYKAYFDEIEPMLFKNGGPIIGVQIENEFCEDEKYLSALIDMAQKIGFSAPYYTVTGWGPHITYFPKERVLPIFGGYPDAPWEQHTHTMPVNTHYFFTPLKNDSTIGNDQLSGAPSEVETSLADYPFLTCELGAGVECTYHRRPIISPMDGYTISLVKLGCGNNMPGYYVFHGGFNPVGGFYQESKITSYPNDLPVSSYDFQAPVGEYGIPRDSYFYLKRIHQFTNSFGDSLSPLKAFFPKELPKGKEDFTTPRLSLRSDGEKAYLFFSTYQRHYPIKGFDKLSLDITLEKNENVKIDLPEIPSGKCGIFPLRENYFGFDFAFSSVQPLWKGNVNGTDTLLFFAVDGIDAKISIDGNLNVTSSVPFEKTFENGKTVISGFTPSYNCSFLINGSLNITVLNESESLNFFPVSQNGENKLLLCDGGGIIYTVSDSLYAFYKNSVNIRDLSDLSLITLNSKDNGETRSLFTLEKSDVNKITENNPYSYYLFDKPENCPEYVLKTKSDFSIYEDIILNFNSNADVIEVYAENALISDDFLKDDSFTVSLKRLRPYLKEGKEIRFKCAPLKENADIYFEYPKKAGEVYLELSSTEIIRTLEIKK